MQNLGHIFKFSKIQFVFLFIFFFFLTSCGLFKNKSVNIEKPELPSEFPSYNNSQVKRIKTLCHPWWEEFEDPKLNNLISQVLKNNNDLQILSLKIEQLKLLAKIKKAELFPNLNLQAQGDFTWFKEPKSPNPQIKADNLQEKYSITLLTSYEIDIWQKISNARKSAIYKLISAKWNKKALEITLSSQTAINYYKIAYLRKKIKLVEKEIALQEKILAILKLRYSSGLIDIIPVKEMENAIALKKAYLLSLKNELYTTQTKMALLTGKYEIEELNPKLPEFLPALPKYLPSDLLKNRPDIIAVEYEIKSANCEYLSALAQRFPTISLTGMGGLQNPEIKELFSSSSLFWNLSVGIFYPIFNYGKLKNLSEEKKLEVKQLAKKYAQTVLNAFWEVETALSREKELIKILNQKKKELKIKRELLAIQKQRFAMGLSDAIKVLNTQIAVLQTKESLLDVIYNLIQNRIFLYKALGGGITQCQKDTSKL